MEIKQIGEKENPLLGRKNLSFDIEFSGRTPSKNEVKKAIAEKCKEKEELLYIKKINHFFGENRVKVIVNVYKDLKVLKDIEMISRKKKEKTREREKSSEEVKAEAKDGKETRAKK